MAFGVAGVLAMMPVGAGAQTASKLDADVTVTTGYSNNPFSQVATGGGTGAGLVTLDLAPHYTLTTPRSTLAIGIDADLQQYFSRYGHNDGYTGNLDYTRRVSERLIAHLDGQVSSSVLGSFNSYFPTSFVTGAGVTPALTSTPTEVGSSAATAPVMSIGPTAPITAVPTTQFSDVGLYGLRNRRTLGQIGGDLAMTLSTRDMLSASAYGLVTRYSNFATGDYQAYGGTLGYSRRLSSRLTLGLSGAGSTYTYRSGIGNSRVFSIQATGSAQLNERWSASGGIGVSMVNGDNSGSTRSTSLSGSLSLCRRDPLSTLCVSLVRQVSPTGVAGTQYVSSAGLSYNRQLNEHQSLSLGVNYSKTGNGTQLLAGALPLQTEYLQATAGYNRRLARRLSLTASTTYRTLLDDVYRRPNDYGGQLGFSYHLGRQ